jgi:CyaY protein
MTDSEFHELARKTLDTIETACEAITQSSDTDIDTARNGEVLALTFENDSKIIINSQAPLQQMWVAAKAGGYHYSWNGQMWIDTRDGSELYATLTKLAQGQAGVGIGF